MKEKLKLSDLMLPLVKNMESHRSCKEIPNQFIIEIGRYYCFQSHDKLICVSDRKNDIIYIDNNWDKFPTTILYLGDFLGGASKKEIQARIERGKYIIMELNPKK